MSTQQRRLLAIGLITAIVGAVSLPVLQAVWNAKVSTADFNIHIITDNARWTADSLERARQTKMLKSVLCTVKPQDTQCDDKGAK
jgi:hypothetical protein